MMLPETWYASDQDRPSRAGACDRPSSKDRLARHDLMLEPALGFSMCY